MVGAQEAFAQVVSSAAYRAAEARSVMTVLHLHNQARMSADPGAAAGNAQSFYRRQAPLVTEEYDPSNPQAEAVVSSAQRPSPPIYFLLLSRPAWREMSLSLSHWPAIHGSELVTVDAASRLHNYGLPPSQGCPRLASPWRALSLAQSLAIVGPIEVVLPASEAEHRNRHGLLRLDLGTGELR
mmetsp:Transcript_118165/g.294750  ORF Transcript_118165/g.294750 Transcript_118165/m.294750 type:complete len:183 (-) Transcript_118165:23-571(-)